MSISFSGLASGLDTSGWVEALVSVKQEKVNLLKTKLNGLSTQKNTLNSTRAAFSSFRSALEKLTDVKFGGTFDLFNKSIAKSSNEEVFTATATNSAIKEDYNIFIKQLATATKAVSNESASRVADDETLLSGIGITNGNLSVYVDGYKHVINIEDGDKLSDLKNAFNEIGVDLSIDGGILTIKSSNPEDYDVVIGATNDTTNFVSILGMEKDENGVYHSSNALYKANISSKLMDENAGFRDNITAGTFTIGDAEFTINEDTTLSSLIYQINNTEAAQVTAYWDSTTGKINLTSKIEGASYINVEAGTSNFTDVMGFTTTERDENNAIVSSRMFIDNQELGQNALFSINGTDVISTSNTVTSDISRIDGVTIKLNRVNTEEDGETTLSITQDTGELVDAVKNFVSEYNNMMAQISEVTASGADLQRESALTSFQTSIRNLANSRNDSNGGAFKLLSELGISTAKADGNNLSTDTANLTLDENKFIEMFESDPDSVTSILAGENGILNMMENSVETMLAATTGYFDIKQNTIDSDIKKQQEKITKQQNKITTYQKQLEDKFSNMELLIAQMQQNYSSFLAG
ncbi:MAG: flagellar filament capping protein FliD [bacterium]|nr:flagellar filament capping protein FliD [bacterium]